MANNEEKNEKKSKDEFTPHGSNPETGTPLPSDSDDSMLDFGAVANIREGASGVIPLTELPDPQSSPSLISWTEVIRQHRETQSIHDSDYQPVQIDSVSDKDLLKRIAAEERGRNQASAAQAAKQDTDKLGTVPIVAEEEGAVIELSLDDWLPPQPPSGSAVRFNVSKPPSDAGGAMPMPWDAEEAIPEAILVDDDLLYDDIPLAEAVPIDEEFPEQAHAPGAVSGDLPPWQASQMNDQDDITAMPIDEDSGLLAGQSSILDILIRESDPSHSRSASGIVDLAGRPGSGVLSSISGFAPVKKGDSDKIVIEDTAPPEIAPGNSWMREFNALASPVADTDMPENVGNFSNEPTAFQADQTGEFLNVDDVAPAIPFDNPWQTEQPPQPIEASDEWAADHLAEATSAENPWLTDPEPKAEQLTELTVEEATELELVEEELPLDDEPQSVAGNPASQLGAPLTELEIDALLEVELAEAVPEEADFSSPITPQPEFLAEALPEENDWLSVASDASASQPAAEEVLEVEEELLEVELAEALPDDDFSSPITPQPEFLAEAVPEEDDWLSVANDASPSQPAAEESLEIEEELLEVELAEALPDDDFSSPVAAQPEFLAEAVPEEDDWLSVANGASPIQPAAEEVLEVDEELLEVEMAEALPEENEEDRWLSGDSGKQKQTMGAFHLPADQVDQEFEKPLSAASGWLIGDEDENQQPQPAFEAVEESPLDDEMDKPLPKGSDWLHEDAGKNRQTMSSFQLPDDNPEEAVDLYAEGPFNSGITDSGSLQISDEQMQEAARKQRLSESSAIDLGSKASSIFNLDMESFKAVREVPVEEMVDMSLPPAGDDDSSMIRRIDDIAADEHLLYSDKYRAQAAPDDAPTLDAEPIYAEEAPIDEDAAAAFFDEPEAASPFAKAPPSSNRNRRQREESVFPDETTEFVPNEEPSFEAAEAPEMAEADSFVEEVEDAPPPPVKPAKSAKPDKSELPRRKRGGLLTGAMFGIVLGGGGLFAANYFEVLPDAKSVVEQTGLVDKQGNGTTPPPNSKPNPIVAASEPPTPLVGRKMMETGDLAKAVAVFDACDPNAPDALAGRGKAKWLLYLQNCAKEGKSPSRDDPAVKAALTDLDGAVDKAKGNDKAETDAAHAYLWQGLVEESLEDYAKAEEIYTKAEAELKSPANKALIQNAKNRLQVLRPAQGTPLSAIPPHHLMLAFIMLLAPEPAGTPDAKELAGQECGFLFWDALLLAKKHDYVEAAKLIDQIKAVHARQQIKMAGRGLNPLSDPREQLLPVSLDELKRYWLICDQLYKRPEAKMLVEQTKTIEALAAVLAKSKESEDVVKMIADKLMLKPEDKPVEAVQTLLTAKTKAEDEKKLVDDMLAAVGKTLKDAGIDDPKVEDGLKKLVAGKVDADTKIKNLAEALDKAGVKEPDTAKALAMLILSRDDAETIVKGLRERFQKAKYIDGDATKDMVFKAIDEAIARGAVDAVVKLAQEKKDAETKVAKLEADADKTKKDAEAIVKKTKDDADALIKKTAEDADAQIKKTEKSAAEQKEMYETRIANSAKGYIGATGKAEELLKAGRYDAALKEYFNGLKSLKVLPKEHEDLLERLIATHPATVKLDTTGTDVGQGLRHYGAGLELFNAARYENAEEEFARAAAFDTKDARYRYFLGLARWLQNKKEAATDDFKAGAALESQSRPASRVINASLERIQGPTRDVIETYRP